jgi:hypothetical protein
VIQIVAVIGSRMSVDGVHQAGDRQFDGRVSYGMDPELPTGPMSVADGAVQFLG